MLRKISLILLVALPLLFPLSTLAAGPLASSLKGRILLQVESKGEAWYVDPVTEKRVFLGRPADAFAVMRSYGLGISNADLAKIAAPGEKSSISSLAKTLAGRILLQVQSKGEAWYVSPVDFKKYYLGRPADAFALMRAKGLGISNANLEKIISKAPAIAPTETLPNVVSAPVTPTAPQTNPASTTPNAEVKATSTTQVPAATETISAENFTWKTSSIIASRRHEPQAYFSSNGDLWLFYSDDNKNLYSKVRKNGNSYFEKENLVTAGAKKASPWFNAQGEIKKLAVSAESQTLVLNTTDNGASWQTAKAYANRDESCAPTYPQTKITGENGELLVFGYESDSAIFGCATNIRSASLKNNAWGEDVKKIGNGDLISALAKNQTITISGRNSVFYSANGGETYTEIKGGDTTASTLGAQSAFDSDGKIFLGRYYSYGPAGEANEHLSLVAGEGAFLAPKRVVIKSSDSTYRGFEIAGSKNIFVAAWTVYGVSGRIFGSISYDTGNTWSESFDLSRAPSGYDIPFLDTGDNVGFTAASLNGRAAIAYEAKKGVAGDIYLAEYK